jgi:hypothetical protein
MIFQPQTDDRNDDRNKDADEIPRGPLDDH